MIPAPPRHGRTCVLAPAFPVKRQLKSEFRLALFLAPKPGYWVHRIHLDHVQNRFEIAGGALQMWLVWITNQMLYQLSYASLSRTRRGNLERGTGIEPV